jgi:hypothetical protein
MELFTQKVVTKLSKIRVWGPGSGINLFRIPDPGVKKHPIPDPESGSATLIGSLNGSLLLTDACNNPVFSFHFDPDTDSKKLCGSGSATLPLFPSVSSACSVP